MNDLCNNENMGNSIIIDKNIKIMQISKSKKYVAFGLSDLHVSIFNLDKKKVDNSDIIDINFVCNINIKDNYNLEENNSNEINLINFSYDEKHILILINKFIINIYETESGKLIHKYNKFNNINKALYISAKNEILLYSNNKLFLSSEIIETIDLPVIYNPVTQNDIQNILFSEFFNLIILIPDSIREIECINLSQKKQEFTIEIKEEIFSANISQTDGGKYLIINSSKNYPKIFLYDLAKKEFSNKYYGHIQKNSGGLCYFGGNKDQYILCASEDLMIYLWDRDISGLPRYQFKQHDKPIVGLGLINSSFVLSCDENYIKLWTSYDIDDVNLNKNKNDSNLMEQEK
jgi:WD40 repeat protein